MPVHSVKRDYTDVSYHKEVDLVTTHISANVPQRFDVLFTPGEPAEERIILAATAEDPHTHLKIPKEWDRYSPDEWLFVKSIDVQQGDGPYIYEVTANYISIENPLDLEPEIEWGKAVSNVEIDRDINGDPILNSAGQSPDPPITEEFEDLVFRMTRNENYFNALLAHEYKGAVNSDIFLGFDPGFAKCIEISGTRARVADLVYWKVRYEIHFRLSNPIPGTPKIGWIRRLLDEGRIEKTGTAGDGTPELLQNKDQEGTVLSEPVLLDGEGKKLADGSPAVYLEFETRRKLPFETLNLPIAV